MPVCRLLARFRDDAGGNVATLLAVMLTTMMGFAAFGIDVGKFFVDRRKMQATVDLAAMSAASNLPSATRMANATVTLNKIVPSTPVSVEFGTYVSDANVAMAGRFQASSQESANAVRVTLQTKSPLFFGRFLTAGDGVPIRTVATATNTGFASFAIGSRLASVDAGLLNQLLGALLGANVALTAVDYQSLLDAKVDVFDLLGAATTRANLTGPTYQSALAAGLTAGDVLAAGADVAPTPAAANALRTLAKATTASRLTLGAMFNVGPYAQSQLGQGLHGAGSLSLFDLLAATAQVANGQHQVAVGLDLQVPGVTSATLSLAVGERPVGSTWFAIGSQGASVHTAQTRLLLQLQVQGLSGLPVLNVPIYGEVAQGTATLRTLACGYPDVATSSVGLGVTPGIVDAWIGNVSSSDFTNFTYAVAPGQATLVNLTALKITGLAHATMSNVSATNVGFTYADTQVPNKKTVSTTDYTSSLVSSLIGNLRLSVTVGPLAIGLPTNTTQAVTASLNAVAVPLDQKLATLFSTLGVGLGQADTWVSGIRCDGAVLVN